MPNATIKIHSAAEEELMIQKTFHDDAVMARQAFFFFNRNRKWRYLFYRPSLIDLAVNLGHLSWVRKLVPYIEDSDILDVGCGNTLHGYGFILAGARSYTGCDPNLQVASGEKRDFRANRNNRKKLVTTKWSPKRVSRFIPIIHYVNGTLSDLGNRPMFDVAILHNVTEHLLSLENIMYDIFGRLRPNGLLIFNHHNFFSWNGHHQRPRTIDEIDINNAEQRQFLDWHHINLIDSDYFKSTDDDILGLSKPLNCIRISDLKHLVERWFDLKVWQLRPMKEEEGLCRLTDAVRAAHPYLTEDELATQNVFCVASKKFLRLGEIKKLKPGKKRD